MGRLAELKEKYGTTIGMFEPYLKCKHCSGSGERTIRRGAESGQSTICVCLYVDHEQSDDVGDMLNGEVMVRIELKDELSIEDVIAGCETPTRVEDGLSGYDRDMEWAYQNSGKKLIKQQAPTSSAFMLKAWCEDDIKAFMAEYRRIQEAREKVKEGQMAMRDSMTKQLSVIEAVMDEYLTGDENAVAVALIRNPTKTLAQVESYRANPKGFKDSFGAKSRRAGEVM